MNQINDLARLNSPLVRASNWCEEGRGFDSHHRLNKRLRKLILGL